MKAEYHDIHNQADRLQHRFGSVADQPDQSSMRTLQRRMRDVMEAIETDKAPKAIEDRIKMVIELLHDISQHDAGALSVSDGRALHEDYEELRREVRRLPNY